MIFSSFLCSGDFFQTLITQWQYFIGDTISKFFRVIWLQIRYFSQFKNLKSSYPALSIESYIDTHISVMKTTLKYQIELALNV